MNMLLSTAERLSHPAPIVMFYRGTLTNNTDTVQDRKAIRKLPHLVISILGYY